MTASLLLGISERTIRRQLKQLEFMCGQRLFVGRTDGLTPTQLALDLGQMAERIALLADTFAGTAARGGAMVPANEP